MLVKCCFHVFTDKIISQVTHLEEENKLSMWTMMPPAVVYNGLFSRNACFLARVCDLLLKYDTSRYPRIRELGLRAKFKEEVICQQLYIADFMNSLWNQNVSNLIQEVDYLCRQIKGIYLDFSVKITIFWIVISCSPQQM